MLGVGGVTFVFVVRYAPQTKGMLEEEPAT